MNEKVEKKEWVKPEIVDLDVEKTAGSMSPATSESSFDTPGPIS